jgi:hypothetical protein
MERRLIDANALCEGRVSNDPVVIAAKCAPTIDAVEVVRCGDCAYMHVPVCCPCRISGFKVPDDWYCPMGVRREPDGE